MKTFFFCTLLSIVSWQSLLALPDSKCPEWLSQSGIVNDIATLSVAIGQDSQVVEGVCGQYTPIHEV